MQRNWACLLLCCSQQVQYKCQVPRGPSPGIRDLPEFTIRIPKTVATKKYSSLAISLTVVARMRSRHPSSKADRYISLLRHHLVKVNLQLAVGSRLDSSLHRLSLLRQSRQQSCPSSALSHIFIHENDCYLP